MATTRTQIKFGSKGDDVKELQTVLNSKGYNLDVDGVFGSKTQAAVRDYQSKNKLQVDGIVGTNTWASLSPTTNTNSSTTTTNTSETQTNTNPTGFTYDPYKESPTVAAAKQALQAQLNNKPDAYQSTYQQQITDVLNKIMNREPFEYDLNGDALYQQYKDQYTTQGKMAMMDTMGQAAALTGGYGNSYAQNAGQQAYHGYLQQLNNKVPELYQLALDQYNRAGDELLSQYSLYSDRENTDYGRYRDDLADYYANLDRLNNQYLDERSFDYGQYTDARNLAYQLSRDQIADAQWQKQYDEELRRWNYANGLNADGTPIATGKSGGGGNPNPIPSPNPEKVEEDMLDPNDASAAVIDSSKSYTIKEIEDVKNAGYSYSDAVIALMERGVDTRLTSVQNDLRNVFGKK